MNKIELCLKNKITSSNNKLQPTIFKAILNLYKKDFVQINARMVKEECIKIDQNNDWPQRLRAICNSMGRTIDCGFRIISENKPHMDFTIAFDGNGINLDTSILTKTLKTELKKNEKPSSSAKRLKKNKKTKPSINKTEEFSKIIEKYNLDKLKNENRPKLLIIPCSKSKSPGGINTFSSIFNLNPNRTNSITLYNNERIINPNYFNNEIRVGVNVVDVNYFNIAFNNNICKKAIDRYDGNKSIFYRNYELKNLYLQKINNNKLHVLIVSGLYGLLRFDDLIPDYHLEMNKNPIWTNPYDFSIRDAVKDYILVNNIPNENVFYSLADNEYRQALKPDLNWKLIWIQNGGIGSSYTTAKFIAQEFLPRL
jgi:cytoplasmic iron level regulating protein YaaA (DUF328/UPF0246 family)